jgi:hypothetical protein
MKTATNNTSAVLSEPLHITSSADSSEVFPRNNSVPASDPSVLKGFYGPDGDYDKSESSDLIFN